MILLKTNKKHSSEIYQAENFYLKKFYKWDSAHLQRHAKLLHIFNPGYLIDYGNSSDYMWTKVKKLEGIPAREFEQTDEFVCNIMQYCINHYKKTYPYAHMEWSLNHIFIRDNDIQICDWDHFGIYPPKEVWQVMHRMFDQMFGKKYKFFLQ